MKNHHNKKIENWKKNMGLLLIIVGVAMRLLPHPANFAPISAIAMFGGTYLNKKYALLIPLGALFLSDLYIGFYNIKLMLSVYGSFLIVGLMGLWLKKHKKFRNVLAVSVASSVIFFLITNFAVWAFSSWYAKSWTGLMQCYTMALPFFRNTLFGDLFYVGVFFGSYELVINWASKKILARQYETI
jgi:hypothetical protein